MRVRRQLVTHTFKGKRFEDHGLDLDVLPDLYAYKELLVATAKELRRRHHPDRQRSPKNFEDSLCLKFCKLTEGSVAVPIFQEVETDGQSEFWKAEEPDELDEAVTLVTDAVNAAGADQPLPESLPKNVIPLFDGYGKTLREDESFELHPYGSQKKAAYTSKSRARLLDFCAAGYNDRVDLTGEVRAVDLGGSFTVRLDGGVKVPARFSTEQEDLVTEALREHASRRLHVKKRAEFHPDGRIKAITAIADLEIRPVGDVAFDPSAKPIWDVIEESSAAVPAGEWASVPANGAQNLDHYLYAHARKSS